jgi:hypothetical protein
VVVRRTRQDAGGGKGDEVKVVPSWQGEVFGFAWGDIEQELFLVPGLVQALVDVERAPVDLAEQDVDVADEEFSDRKAHRCAACAAAAGLNEHHRAAPGRAQEADRLARGQGRGDAGQHNRLGHHEP